MILLLSLLAFASGIDLAYLGRWYQVYSDLAVISTFENSSFCVTADYGAYPNGTISVLNRERQESIYGPERPVYGWADVENASEPHHLTVYLQTANFPAPYWIYQLGPNISGQYQYSIVSDPFKLTLFVLARNVTDFADRWNTDVSMWLYDNGFTRTINSPITTTQNGCIYWS